jgi:hypothetical protein
MVIRLAAAVTAGLMALAAPASAQVKDRQKADEGRTVQKLEAEIAKLRAIEAELTAKLTQMRTELDRKGALERIEKSVIERQIEEVKKQADIERQRAKAEFEKTIRQRDEELKRAEIEFERAARIRDENLKLAQIERERTTLRGEQDKPRFRVVEAQVKGQDKPRVVVLEAEVKDKPKVVVLGEGGKVPVPYEKMSAQELKQVITKLQILLEEKARAEKGKPGVEKVKPVLGEKVKPGAVSQEEILMRLDKLSREIEEIKRSIKR